MKEKPFNRCTDCGKFIAYKDFESGEARMSMVSPDSEYSIEEYEVQCKRCNLIVRINQTMRMKEINNGK